MQSLEDSNLSQESFLRSRVHCYLACKFFPCKPRLKEVNGAKRAISELLDPFEFSSELRRCVLGGIHNDRTPYG